MSKSPLVSVIVPNYNYARFLDQRMQTILNQTYRNFEVIILDDCSTDNSLEVIKKYQDDPRVREVIINNKNTGSPFKQWDRGIRFAKGEFIWIAEADDYCELNLLEELIAELNKHKNVALAFSSYVHIYGDKEIRNEIKEKRCYRGVPFIKNRMARGNMICNASGVIFRRDLYCKISSRYLVMQSSGDYQFWVEICALGKVVYVPRNLTYLRRHESTVTNTKMSRGITAQEDKEVFEYIHSRFRLNRLQIMLAKYNYFLYYNRERYESEEIKAHIFEMWSLKNLNLERCAKLMRWSRRIENKLHVLI